MTLDHATYLDRVLGGWIGKSIGGAIGARFEGDKRWVEVDADALFPEQIPPNDDLDLQVLWLKVLEEQGPALSSDDLARAWLEHCWYPFNEYGIFRRNWRLGIHPPDSGRFGNEHWETGMGCPIRSELWGYVFPGAPLLAAEYARRDGVLDHTEASVGVEMMGSAMASMAFEIDDIPRLAAMFWHYLPAGSPVEQLVRAAFEAHAAGLSLREARERLVAAAGHPEACDIRLNVPFTFLALLYGKGDFLETMLSALRCGYDTDCTMATAGAFLGQIQGAARIDPALRNRIGDELVMGIAYHRPEMTLSALARDTVRMGRLLSVACRTGTVISGGPEPAPAPWKAAPDLRLGVVYEGPPAAAPGTSVDVTISVSGTLPAPATLELAAPENWDATPASATVGPGGTPARFTLSLRPQCRAVAQRNLFTARLAGRPAAELTFGVAGAALWQFLGVYFDPRPPAPPAPPAAARIWTQHYVSLDREYIDERRADADALFRDWSRRLGKPALVTAPAHRLDLAPVTRLDGPYCAYLARTVICPDDRDVYLAVGNNDAYRIYLDGAAVAEERECLFWTPFNGVWPARLRRGANRFLVKLLNRTGRLEFSFGIRHRTGHRHGFNAEDWCVDLADVNPLANPIAG
jgi:ADP-ribosylglycohydrolase